MKAKLYAAALLACFLYVPLMAQRKGKNAPAPTPVVAKTDTAKNKPSSGLQPYKRLITSKAKTQKGLFTVHRIGADYFFEIPDSVINRAFLTVVRTAKAPTGAGYGGEEEHRHVLRWEKGPNNKLFLRAVLNINTSIDPDKPITQAVLNSNVEPIAAAFDIKSVRKDTSVVINVTDFFKGDNQLITLDPSTKRGYNLTTIQTDRSYIQSIKSFPINTEVRMVKTYTSVTPPQGQGQGQGPGNNVVLPAGASTGVVTLEINASMVLLPKTPARKRLFDNRVGFFASGYTVYGEESQRSETEVFAVHWKLEPKSAEDVEKMKRGELIEPKKPIIYHIDPATPVKWRKYLKLGVEDWQKLLNKPDGKMRSWPKKLTSKILSVQRMPVTLSFAISLLIFRMRMDLMLVILAPEKLLKAISAGIIM